MMIVATMLRDRDDRTMMPAAMTAAGTDAPRLCCRPPVGKKRAGV
jgi:hypothetical protein